MEFAPSYPSAAFEVFGDRVLLLREGLFGGHTWRIDEVTVADEARELTRYGVRVYWLWHVVGHAPMIDPRLGVVVHFSDDVPRVGYNVGDRRFSVLNGQVVEDS